MKNNKLKIKALVFCFFLLFSLSCSLDPKEKIKVVLDNYEQINKDFDVSMREMHKNNPNVSLLQSLDAAKNRCDKLNKINTSETPTDFHAAFKKLVSIGCDNLNSPADLVTYEGDPKIKAFHDAEREIEEVSSKYGFNYKFSTSSK